mmetsp:Transcript_46778/g.89327  ORF Transcript_46778/g.89327 Transcript_46778/m.89327 type:complete len:223 (-) Transcript_46778:1924-2592(-)
MRPTPPQRLSIVHRVGRMRLGAISNQLVSRRERYPSGLPLRPRPSGNDASKSALSQEGVPPLLQAALLCRGVGCFLSSGNSMVCSRFSIDFTLACSFCFSSTAAARLVCSCSFSPCSLTRNVFKPSICCAASTRSACTAFISSIFACSCSSNCCTMSGSTSFLGSVSTVSWSWLSLASASARACDWCASSCSDLASSSCSAWRSACSCSTCFMVDSWVDKEV